MEELGGILIIEDGARYHRGVATKPREQYEKDDWQGWGLRTWPANSLDLNPLENLWHLLRTHVKKRDSKPMPKQDLIEVLKKEWAKMDMKKINALIESMPARMQAVIDAAGDIIHY